MHPNAAHRSTGMSVPGRSPGLRLELWGSGSAAFPRHGRSGCVAGLLTAYRCGGSVGIVVIPVVGDAPTSRFIPWSESSVEHLKLRATVLSSRGRCQPALPGQAITL